MSAPAIEAGIAGPEKPKLQFGPGPVKKTQAQMDYEADHTAIRTLGYVNSPAWLDDLGRLHVEQYARGACLQSDMGLTALVAEVLLTLSPHLTVESETTFRQLRQACPEEGMCNLGCFVQPPTELLLRELMRLNPGLTSQLRYYFVWLIHQGYLGFSGDGYDEYCEGDRVVVGPGPLHYFWNARLAASCPLDDNSGSPLGLIVLR